MKKQLLQESEIRKMMKFANIGALSNDFIEKLEESVETGELAEGQDDEMDEGMHGNRDDDEMDEGMYGKRDDELDEQEEPGADPMDDEEDMGEPEPEMDMDDDMPAAGGGDLPPEAVEKLESLVDSLKAVLSVAGEDGQALADALSVEKEGGDAPMGLDAGAPDMGDMDEPEMGMDDDESPAGDPMEEDMMLEEVARRVARRLRRLKRR